MGAALFLVPLFTCFADRIPGLQCEIQDEAGKAACGPVRERKEACMGFQLERFVKEQAYCYEEALNEVRNGRKESHWIWFVFPQLKGLGSSSASEYFGISGREEAAAYLADPVLGARLLEITQALLAQPERDPEKIFGFPDVLKVRSCMTLFESVCMERDSVFSRVLDEFYQGVRDTWTLQKLEGKGI